MNYLIKEKSMPKFKLPPRKVTNQYKNLKGSYHYSVQSLIRPFSFTF